MHPGYLTAILLKLGVAKNKKKIAEVTDVSEQNIGNWSKKPDAEIRDSDKAQEFVRKVKNALDEDNLHVPPDLDKERLKSACDEPDPRSFAAKLGIPYSFISYLIEERPPIVPDPVATPTSLASAAQTDVDFNGLWTMYRIGASSQTGDSKPAFFSVPVMITYDNVLATYRWRDYSNAQVGSGFLYVATTYFASLIGEDKFGASGRELFYGHIDLHHPMDNGNCFGMAMLAMNSAQYPNAFRAILERSTNEPGETNWESFCKETFREIDIETFEKNELSGDELEHERSRFKQLAQTHELDYFGNLVSAFT